ncbi:unnamed protein product [Camellia sinensis]
MVHWGITPFPVKLICRLSGGLDHLGLGLRSLDQFAPFTEINCINNIHYLFRDHPWIREHGDASDKPIDVADLTRMKQFRAMNKLKKEARAKENLSEEEIVGLKEIFKSMDADNSGTITFEELKAGLSKMGSKLIE